MACLSINEPCTVRPYCAAWQLGPSRRLAAGGVREAHHAGPAGHPRRAERVERAHRERGEERVAARRGVHDLGTAVLDRVSTRP